jgi:uncharacterized membrane protein YgdD (TMEM256/DUF423 family)
MNQTLSRRILFAAAICGALGVLLGAWGAHGLDTLLESRGDTAQHVAKRLDQFDVAVRYHLIHSVALLALAAIPGAATARRWTFRLLLLGLVLFSGSLYVLVLSDEGKFGMITPLGGLSWIAAWLSLILVAKGAWDTP